MDQLEQLRSLLVEHAGGALGLRPKALPAAVKLLDWKDVDVAEGDPDGIAEQVAERLAELRDSDDYLFADALVPSARPRVGDIDGGRRSAGPIEDSLDDRPLSIASARARIVNGHAAGGGWSNEKLDRYHREGR